MVLFDARYPVKPVEHATVIHLQAERMFVVWSKEEFTRLRQLVLRVKAHVSKIDMDNTDPMTVSSIKIDEDGYVVYRIGGRLPPRVTYRYSTVQRAAGEARLECCERWPMLGASYCLDSCGTEPTSTRIRSSCRRPPDLAAESVPGIARSLHAAESKITARLSAAPVIQLALDRISGVTS